MRKVSVFLLLLVLAAADVAMAQQYQVGVCDWMILKRQKLGEFSRAREIGADGVELDMGGLGNRAAFDNQLRDPQQAALFRHVADSLGVKIGAMAMSGFYGQSLAKKDSYREMAMDCFDTMDRMGSGSVVFLPLGGSGNDWITDKALRKEIVKRLHEMGEMAKKIFYKWQTILENKWDLLKDLKALGTQNICAMHASNTDGVCLRDDKQVDVPAIKALLDQMKWSGWLFVERSRDTTMVRNVVANYSNNVNYLKSIFNSLPEAEVKLNSGGRDPQYVETILGRAKKVTDEFSLTYTPMGQNLRNIVANRYFELNDIYAERDSLTKTDKKLAEAVCDSKLYRSHFAFDANLAKYLDPSRIERVKDVMTFNVVKVTYEAQCDMIPTLKDEEKQQILLWLKEARELAIDAESSNKKHEVFGKYKGRINNYLSKRGYDLTKEREAWYERVKARGGQL